MGSSQSQPSKHSTSDDSTNISNSKTGRNSSSPTDSSDLQQNNDVSTTPPPTATKTNKKPPKDESGFAKAQRKCRKKKRAYDACYTAQLSNKEEDCHELFDAYRTCFTGAMAKDMERRRVNVNAGSMIGEYIEEMDDEEGGEHNDI